MNDDKPSTPGPLDYASEGSLRIMKPRRAGPADAVRPTRAEINLGALRTNLSVLRERAGKSHIYAVLKADGYGHGAPAIARTLERAKVDGFSVALLEEAIELREAGIRAPILVMGGYYGRAYAEIVHRDLIPVVYDESQFEGLALAARALGLDKPVSVHLKIDTGMARLGARPETLGRIAAALAKFPEIRVDGLMTHLANADAATADPTEVQIIKFDEATAQLAKLGIRTRIRHAANSAALLKGAALLDWVRPGLAIFGICPSVYDQAPLEQVMRVRTEVIDVRTIEAGDAVGYGSIFRAKQTSRIATVAMGYADGLPRALSSKGSMGVRGKKCAIVGAISMDMTMLDVTDAPGVTLGDEVLVMGAQDGPLGKVHITAEHISEQAGLIPWEVVTHISRRVPRFYREP
jgi:alanine racemase